MQLVSYTIAELRNMKFPNLWAKENKEQIQDMQFSSKYSIPIIADIDGRKTLHILSEFHYLESHFLLYDENEKITCIQYNLLSKDDAYYILKAQEAHDSGFYQIRVELDLLTDEEKKVERFNAAFNVEKEGFFKHINEKYDGKIRRINEKSLIGIYEKLQLDDVFAPLRLELTQQVDILSTYTKGWYKVFDPNDDRYLPKISMIRYLWALYPAILELLIKNEIIFNSDDYKKVLNDIYKIVIEPDIEKLTNAQVAEATTISIANRHSKSIKKMITVTTFNPFDL